MRGAGPASVGRDQRPLWVSCRPTKGGRPETRASSLSAAIRAASRSSRRSAPMVGAFSSLMRSWWGLARPSARTATASPPQIHPAPDCPKRRQRRRVSSVGLPSRVPSQPSIGWITQRFSTRGPSALPLALGSEGGRAIAFAIGESGAGRISSSQGRGEPSSSSLARRLAAFFSDATLGKRTLTAPVLRETDRTSPA